MTGTTAAAVRELRQHQAPTTTPRPQRIQRSRAKDARMPNGALYVGRPTKWGNRWRVGAADPERAGQKIDAARAVELYGLWIGADGTVSPENLRTLTAPLRGRDLACWCPLDQPCHADVLLEVAGRFAA